MAGVLGTPAGSLYSKHLTFDDDSDATGSDDVRSGATTLYAIQVEDKATAIAHVKLYDHQAPVIGTTDPDFIFPAKSGENDTWVCVGGAIFANGLSWATVTEAGTAGTSSPGTPQDIRVVTSS